MFSTTEAVGIYGYSAKLVFLVYFPMFAFGASIPPIFSSAYSSGDHDELERVTRKSTRWILSMSMPIILVLILEGKFILRHVYGVEFEPGYVVLVILTAAHLISSGTGLVGLFLQMTGQHKAYMKLNIFFFVLNVMLNIILVRLFGMLGAAMATAFCMAMLEIACAYIIHRKFSIIVLPEGAKFDVILIFVVSVFYAALMYYEIYMGLHVLLVMALGAYIWKSISCNDIPWRLLLAKYRES
jgi:O-antigen/teichoic acid export membrane protein